MALHCAPNGTIAADDLLADPRGDCLLASSMIDCTRTGAVTVGSSAEFRRGDPVRTVLKTPVGDPRNTHVATVSLGFHFLDATGGELAQRWDGVCMLEWGQGGTKFRAELDWHNGVQVSVPASSIEVSAFNADRSEAQAESVQLRAAVAWGHRAARSYPKRSFVLAVGMAASSPILPVPNFAFAAQMATPTPATVYVAGVTLIFFADPGGAIPVQIVNGIDLRAALAGEGIKLVQAARFWRVANTLAEAISVFPFFALSL